MDIQSCQPEEGRPDHRALPKSCNNVGYVSFWDLMKCWSCSPKMRAHPNVSILLKGGWWPQTPPPAKDCPWATAEAPLLAVLVLGEQALVKGL